MANIVYSCPNHVEELIDYFLDEQAKMPVMVAEKDTSKQCLLCQQAARYRLLGSEVEFRWE